MAGRIEDALANHHEMFRYVGSTQKLFVEGFGAKALVPWRTFYNQQVAEDLRREQERNRHDLWLVHNVFPALSPAVYAVAREMGIPIVHYLHNYRLSCANGYFLNHGQPCQRCAQGNFFPAWATGCWRDSRWISGWMGLILQKMRQDDIFHQVRRWIVPSENQKNIHLRMGLPAARVDVVPHFLEAKNPPPAHPQGDVLYLGRLSPEKGVEFLLQAWAKTAPQGRQLVIAGTGPEEGRLRQLAASLNLTNVQWLGFVPRSKHFDLWSKTAFSVMPSQWEEPFGLAFLEAWNHGRPFIATRIGALAEALSDSRGGLLAESGSSESLARQIQRYLQNPSEVVQAGAEGHARLIQENNKPLWLQRVEEVFEKSLHPEREPRRVNGKTMEMFHACTLFDSGFLAKGLALHASLKRMGNAFRLHVFAMDELTAEYLESLQDPTLVVVRRKDFEGPELLRVKTGRTRSEYYWTCGSSSLLYCLEKLGLPRCTYLDADVCFYGDPRQVEAMMGDQSIGITPHNYSAPYDQNRTHGVYCVQYVTIRNDERGLRALRWWRDQCLQWCFGKVEAGRFGDQKYLDDWPERFPGVQVLDAPGVGLAPWNCRDFDLRRDPKGGWLCRDRSDGAERPLTFFHFHELRFFPQDQIKLVAGGYEIPAPIREHLYRPYLRELLQHAEAVTRRYPTANPLAIAPPGFWKRWGAKTYSRLNPRFHDHYISLREALGD